MKVDPDPPPAIGHLRGGASARTARISADGCASRPMAALQQRLFEYVLGASILQLAGRWPPATAWLPQWPR
eukprot:8918362-Alexandrium_andersonii.AAC.1